LIHALWQTSAGRTRFDVDAIGGFTLVAAGMLLLIPVAALIRGAALMGWAAWFGLPTGPTR